MTNPQEAGHSAKLQSEAEAVIQQQAEQLALLRGQLKSVIPDEESAAAWRALRALGALDRFGASTTYKQIETLPETEAADDLLQQANAVLIGFDERLTEVHRQLDRALAKLGE